MVVKVFVYVFVDPPKQVFVKVVGEGFVEALAEVLMGGGADPANAANHHITQPPREESIQFFLTVRPKANAKHIPKATSRPEWM